MLLSATRILALVMTLLFAGSEVRAQTLNLAKYAWEFPEVTRIKSAQDLTEELRGEIQRVLAAGHLAPLDCRYADLMPSLPESHFLYLEPGRIITTLAWTYPHLSTTQQTQVRHYVANELAEDRFAPWGEYPMPKDVGVRRELHPMDRVWAAEVKFGQNRPAIAPLYGLWLYAFRSGDWSMIQTNWPKIRSAYQQRSAHGNLYGTMGAHIAIARLAERFGDADARTSALANLQAALETGQNFAAVEQLCRTNYYREYYTSRNISTNSLYHGEMFLNLTPEIGRYLRDQVPVPVLERHNLGKTRFPSWWLVQAPYFCRWTGDEGTGLSPEAVGMIAPLERWVVQADTTTLRSYLLSVPAGKGDCYWIEMLVQAIEAHGTLEWRDVRQKH